MAEKKDPKQQLRELIDALRDPLRLRIAVTVVVAVATYFGVYNPLAEQIAKKQKILKTENQKANLAQDIEFLQSQVAQIDARIPEDADTNEFAQFVLSGVRSRPVTLVRLEPDKERKTGMLKAIVLRLEVAGASKDLDDLMAWLEDNERVFRIDTVKIAGSQETSGQQMMRITLLGLNA